MYAAAQLTLSTVIVSAESVVEHSTPAARVTWNTTVPPECVASYRVEFRNNGSHGPVVAHNTTTNSSETEIIQTGLQCRTDYYINVVVTGEIPHGIQPMLNSRQVQVLVGGKCTIKDCYLITATLWWLYMYRIWCTSSTWSES